jgi:hypothetical protein
MDAVHFYSRGIPRVINLLCEHALINAYVDHVQPVPQHIVAEVAREFQFDDIKPVAPFKDSRDAMDSDLIVTQSRFKSGPVSPSATADPPWKEQPSALTTPFLAPFAVADTVLGPIKESAKPVLVLEPDQILDLKGDAEASRPLDVRVIVPAVPSPTRIEAGGPSELIEFFSEVITQFGPGLEMKPVPLAPPPLLHVVEAKRWSRLCLAWRDRCLTSVGSIDWRRGKASVYRWLRQPSNPTQWRLPDWRLFEGLRSFNYKKM